VGTLGIIAQFLVLIPALIGSFYAVVSAAAVLFFCRRRPGRAATPSASWPAVSILKPIYGLEKNLAQNLRSTCAQDYPSYQVVLSVQRLDDPALPLLREIEREFGRERVTVVAEESAPVLNGKVQNLCIAFRAARHDVLVISDSDVELRPDYLATIVAPLRDPAVGYVCTGYRATHAERWYERLELLTLNADFVTNVIFASVTGASGFCLGASTALRRATLEAIGGFEALADYLVEDFEMGRRIRARGLKGVMLPYFVDSIVDLESAGAWWRHHVYWDQNTRAARPGGFFASVLVRGVPFALLFAILRFFDGVGVGVLAATLAARLLAAAAALSRHGIDDPIGSRSLHLLPLRDLASLASWVAALSKRTFVWRGLEFGLTRDGRIVAREPGPSAHREAHAAAPAPELPGEPRRDVPRMVNGSGRYSAEAH
jgi:ceramide glucosyltransferase